MLEIGLFIIVLAVLVLPVAVHAVEKNLEVFLFVMGLLALGIAHFWGPVPVITRHLFLEALREPLTITAAVLVAGTLIHFFKAPITGAIVSVERAAGSRPFAFMLVTALGLLSSVITAIMAAIILVEVVGALRLDKRYETRLVILGCFSIGLGAALTPIGEPLSTICVAKLRGEPYNADFLFLLRTLGAYIVPGILALGALGASLCGNARETSAAGGLSAEKNGGLPGVFLSAGKVYLFIMALLFLGEGFKPLVERYIVSLPGGALYWINTLSAVMDNATLAAAEISPRMSFGQLQYVLMGLLVAGGMLIPGNIPNIIAANRLKIGSRTWAATGLPLGLALMLAYFAVFAVLA